eukprot:5679872-Pleurochrysis_carterae.AAC.1
MGCIRSAAMYALRGAGCHQNGDRDSCGAPHHIFEVVLEVVVSTTASRATLPQGPTGSAPGHLL